MVVNNSTCVYTLV